METRRVVFPEAECPKCGGVVIFCRFIDKNGNNHCRLLCVPCNKCIHQSITESIRNRYGIPKSDYQEGGALPLYRTSYQNFPRPLKKQIKANPQELLDKIRSKAIPENISTGDKVAYLRSLPYSEYLKTSHWKKKRQKALEAARHRCQLCNSDKNLQVHHRTYEHKGYEPLKDLTVLCDACHDNFHKNRKLSR